MDPYYSHTHTFGPVSEGAGVDRGMHQFFGAANGGTSNYQRTTVWEVLTKNKHLNLYGNNIGAVEETAAAAAGSATVALFSGAIITGLAINYALGRFVGAPAIEYFSGNKLSDKQKNAVGIVTMLF